MKALLLLLALVATSAHAFPTGYHTKEIYNAVAPLLDAGQPVVVKKAARAVLSVPSTGYASGDVIALNTKIPANAIVSNYFYKIDTAVVSASDNTVQVACDGEELFAAADLTDLTPGHIEGVWADASGDLVAIDNECSPQVTIGAGASGLTAGKVIYFFEYLLSE